METGQINWIDTHCHLYVREFDHDREEMINRAIKAGVNQMYLPNIDADTVADMWDLVRKFPDNCHPMLGLHPTSVKENYSDVLDQMEADLTNRKYAGIGETGTDLYWDTTYRKEQEAAFHRQIEWAIQYDLPVIIHSRSSLELSIDIVREHQQGRLRGIFHCFSGEPSHVEEIQELGFKVGIGGVVTFKKSGLDTLLPVIPRELIVLETDSPFLAPVPYRGKRNESAWIPLIAAKVAEVLQISLNELSDLTRQNAEEVFRKPS
jgi:TatD DNase family protein